jgi:hypothetical protein
LHESVPSFFSVFYRKMGIDNKWISQININIIKNWKKGKPVKKSNNFWQLFQVQCPKLHHLPDMVFNATFNNISVILWRSVLLVEETGVPLFLLLIYLYMFYPPNHLKPVNISLIICIKYKRACIKYLNWIIDSGNLRFQSIIMKAKLDLPWVN